MKAIIVAKELEWQEVPEVRPGVGEVLIENYATAVNRADLVQRAGGYPPPAGASEILGLECAGEVIALGEGVTRVGIGDRVCALLSGGGYAERVNVPAAQVLPVPDGLSLSQAAALPEVFATAYLNLYMEAKLKKSERVLLHAGASGVGTAAIQLCRAFQNPCYVTAGSEDKIQRCIELGAVAGHNRHSGSFSSHVSEWTGGQGMNVILDPVAAGYLADNLISLSDDGRLVVIGLMGGSVTEINLGLVLMKRLRIIGSTLRARSAAFKGRVLDDLRERVWPLIEKGHIAPVLDRELPIQDAEMAHQLVASDQTFGKVVLRIRD